MTMSIERQRRVFEILDQVLETDTLDRASLLDELCAADSELRSEVEALVKVQAPTGLLDAPVFNIHEDPAIGRRVGDYELLELIGRGGMGTVYLARRESFDQRVAVKIIRRGLDLDPVLVQRFHNERQMLARLEHPGIARLLDGGTTGDSLPYVVMEYVVGEPIDVYCRRHGLNIRQRLDLFCKVLDTVRYAHQNLIVHRDLKPGNILINGDGQPKLLDFGIAKWLDDSLAVYPLQTATGDSPMTPRYASPEQIRHRPISTASDVYVLGVLLFELLTGVDAYGTSEPDEMTQAVCDVEAERPSTAVRRRASDLPELEAKRLRRRLLGDLDCIVLKAMRKDPSERYGSVEQLADDIRRHLDAEPVRARRGNLSYRAGKLMRRHRLAFGVLALIILTLATATIISLNYSIKADRATRRAKGAAKRAEKLFDFVDRAVAVGASDKAKGSRKLPLEEEEALLRDLSPSDLAALVKITRKLGSLWRNSGDFDLAHEAMVVSLRWAQKAHGTDHPEVTKSYNNLGAVLVDLERYEEAVALFRDQFQTLEREKVTEQATFRLRSNLATVLKHRGDFEAAGRIHNEVLAQRLSLYESVYGPFDEDIATSRHNVAAVEYAAGRFESALESATLALYGREWKYGCDDPWTSTTRNLQGQILTALARPRSAAEVLALTLEHRIQHFGEFDHRVAETQRHLAAALIESDLTGAEALLLKAIETFKRRPGTWRLADARSVLTLLQARAGRFEDTSLAKSSYEGLAEVRGERSTPTLRAYERWQEVERLLKERESNKKESTAVG